MLGDPPILMLDEPFNGLDPEGIVWMRGFLRSLAAAGPRRLRLQPPDGRAAGHRRPRRGDRPRAWCRRRQRSELLAAASGGEVMLRTAEPGRALEVLRGAGATATAVDHDTLQVTGLEAQRIVAALGEQRCPSSRWLRSEPPSRASIYASPAARSTTAPAPIKGARDDRRSHREARRRSTGPQPLRHVLHAEWTKLRTVRGWLVGIALIAVFVVLFTFLTADGVHAGGVLRSPPAPVVRPSPTATSWSATR